MLPLRLLDDGSARLQRRFSFDVRLSRFFDAGVQVRHAGAQSVHLPGRFLALRGFARRLRIDFRQLADDLLAARLEPLRQLRQPDVVQFELVLGFLQLRNLPPQTLRLRPALLEFDFVPGRGLVEIAQPGIRTGTFRKQGFDFTLPGQNAVNFGIRGMKTDAGRGEYVPLSRDEHGTRSQGRGDLHALAGIGQDVDTCQPVREDPRQSRVGASHVVGQAFQPRGRGLCGECLGGNAMEGKLAGRGFREPDMRLAQVIQSDAVQAFAQHRLQGVVPAFSNADALPQVCIAAQVIAVQPGLKLARPRDLILQRLQGRQARVQLMHPLLGLLRRLFRALQGLLAHRQGGLALFERIAPAGKLVAEFTDLGLQPDQFAQVRHFECVALLFQPGAARRELLQQLVGVAFARIFQA